MDSDLFFSTPRWKILEIIANKPSSPVEISQNLNTSVSYVSQQLKLLEAVSLIVKERTRSAEKGKPRMIYSLSREIANLSILIRNSPAKKTLYLTEHHKLILRIWLLENSEFNYYIEKLYWRIEEDIKDIEGIFVDNSEFKPKVLIISENKKLKQKVEIFLKEIQGKIDCSIISNIDLLKKEISKIHPIHDPKYLLFGKKLKGGLGKNGE